MTDPIESTVKTQNKIICSIAQETYPGGDSCNAVEKIPMYNHVSFAIDPNVGEGITYAYSTEARCIRDHGSQKLVMIASDIDNICISL